MLDTRPAMTHRRHTITTSLALLALAALPACTNVEKNPAFEPSVPVAEGRRPIGLYGEPAQEPPLAQPGDAAAPH